MVQTLTLRLTLIRTQTLSPLKTVLSAEELKNGLKRHRMGNYIQTPQTKMVSENDQEIPQSQTADNPMAP